MRFHLWLASSLPGSVYLIDIPLQFKLQRHIQVPSALIDGAFGGE